MRPRSLRTTIFLDTLGRLLPGGVIHDEAPSRKLSAPSHVVNDLLDAANRKRARKAAARITTTR